MKQLLILFLLTIITTSCVEDQPIKEQPTSKPVKYKAVFTKKVIKYLKEINNTNTSYHYKYDILSGKFRLQPEVSSDNQYFIIYTDNTKEEVSLDNYLLYSNGDTITKTNYIIIN